MKRFLVVLMVATLFWACHSKVEGPIRTVEDGVEVVDNGTGVFPSADGPHSLALKEEFRIDLESEALAAAGLTDITAIDADSKGRIYLFRKGISAGPYIFQLDDQGKLLKSFCPNGQGPGEVEFPQFLGINASDEISLISERYIVFFDTQGTYLRRSMRDSGLRFLGNRYKRLANGMFLAQYIPLNKEMIFEKYILGLFDGQFHHVADIREYELPDETKAWPNPLAHVAMVGVSGSSFFVNWGVESRDIAVFDLDGRMKRIIRAAFPASPISNEYKKSLIDQLPKSAGAQLRQSFESIQFLPPFQAFWTDEKGHLFVSTLEKDPVSGAFLCDVFSNEGVRISRVGMGYQDYLRDQMINGFSDVVLKNGRCYCVREKPDGFKEVVVSAMIWR
jgi:hypothetical protein